MTIGFSLLDLMHSPPNLRRIMRLMLRHQRLREEQIWHELQQQTADAPDWGTFMDTLSDLCRRGWLDNEYRNGQPEYRIVLRHTESRLPDNALTARADLEGLADTQRYQTELGALTQATSSPPPAPRASDPLDGLLHRGGKRTLPKNIWDKLDAPAADSAPPAQAEATAPDAPPVPPAEEPPRRSRGKDLLNLF